MAKKPYRTILVTSCKGGVGKSTVAANLGMALASLGRHVLLLDCDAGNRCLDLLFGAEDSVLFDISDVAAGRVSPERALIRPRESENLAFCPGPGAYGGELENGDFPDLVDRLAKTAGADVVLVDLPGSMEAIVSVAASCADSALIVASHQPSSLRAADKTGAYLELLGVSDQRLIINCFDSDGVLSGGRAGILEMIDRTSTQIIGIVPESPALRGAQERGILAAELKGDVAAAAFANIAGRMCGAYVPLFSGMRKYAKKKLCRI